MLNPCAVCIEALHMLEDIWLMIVAMTSCVCYYLGTVLTFYVAFPSPCSNCET